VRAGRTFTVVTQALDESGAPTETKAMPSIGVWDASDPVGAAPVGAAPGMNGLAVGESWLRVTSAGSDLVRIGIADQRGDGRPDYPYSGWVLYADTVQPPRLAAAGGPIVIRGEGFRLADTVLVGGQPAVVTSVSPNEIDAIAPPAAGVTGSVDVEVDDLPSYYAASIVSGGLSYDSGTGDALTLLTAPMNTVPIGVPLPFTVTALGAGLVPAAGVTVNYAIIGGSATLACGKPSCAVTTSGDGRASLNLTANDATRSIVTAALTNGASLQAHFSGGTPPVLAALTPRLSLAAGAILSWPVQALVLNNGLPVAAQAVSWQSAGTGIAAQAASSPLTNESGVASEILTVGPLAEGQLGSIDACLNGTSQCVVYTAIGARPEFATLTAVSGTVQTLGLHDTPAQIVLRLLDMDGNQMAGGTVSLYQALYAWAPPCPLHNACPPSALLGTQTATATSSLDGTVTFLPASLPGVATSLRALAASGDTSTVSIRIEQHP